MNNKITNHYFSHDYNARSDHKIIKLRTEMGAEGYGIYFMIVELLYQSNAVWELDAIQCIAFELNIDVEKIKHVIFDFDLFEIDTEKNIIYSKSLRKRLDKITQKSLSAKQSAFKRWGNEKATVKENINNANALRTHSECNAINKINKINKIKNNIYDQKFIKFWELYPRKTSKFKSAEAFSKLNENEKDLAISKLPEHIKSEQWSEEQYIPHASTWINQRRWEDEVYGDATKVLIIR